MSNPTVQQRCNHPIVYCDGCGGGRKPLGIGVYSADCGIELNRQLDQSGTSNEAECLAAIAALEECKRRGFSRIRLLSDSHLVVNRANGVYAQRCRTAKRHIPKLQRLLREVEATIEWIPGRLNFADSYSRNLQERGIENADQQPC